tara:strand:+ start:347 stop:949 length:603 start_codon:yes stop_codon:yes gene_type:complete
MIISPKYKFVFLATEKTGSTTIHTVLKKISDDQLIDKSEDNILENGSINNYIDGKHLFCERFIKKYPTYINYFKFAFVRNPWDRVVSWYFFEKKCFTNEKRDLTNVKFRQYIQNYQNIWANKRQSQYEFTKCCDYIGRFENIQVDFNAICDKIGIARQKLPHKNKTTHKHYTKYYDEETKSIVAEKFSKDVEHFGYRFGS